VAYVFDIAIEEAERGKGLGRATMLAAEEYVRRQGQAEIGLNVFGFNEPARALYESLGYHVVAVQMRKQLD
jgi:ribosomal protein S18 acetylase RimI-like enzyme